MYWLVFNQRRENTIVYRQNPEANPQPVGRDYTEIRPVGIFRCDLAEDACRAAAAKHQLMGTYFAIEGTPWGVDMLEIEGVEELGAEQPLAGDEKERRLRALERSVLERDLPE